MPLIEGGEKRTKRKIKHDAVPIRQKIKKKYRLTIKHGIRKIANINNTLMPLDGPELINELQPGPI